jgi:hypothetical protein
MRRAPVWLSLWSVGCWGDGPNCDFVVPDVGPLGELAGVSYYDNDCVGGDADASVVVAGVRLCPDAQVLGATWPTYPTHEWIGGPAAGEPVIDAAAYAASFTADADGNDVAGYARMLVDADQARDEMVLASGAGGVARTRANDDSAPPSGAPMETDTFALIGSVRKLVSTAFFLRMLEDIAVDAELNPSGLTVPQLLELPVYHFLPQDWKGCIGNAGWGVGRGAVGGRDGQHGRRLLHVRSDPGAARSHLGVGDRGRRLRE